MMPPPAFNLKLTDSEIDTIRRWIEAGVPSDEGAAIAAKKKEETARFEKLALPIFEKALLHLSCHGQTDGWVDLRTLQSVLKGSEDGPVISDLGSIKSILIRKVPLAKCRPRARVNP